jgi:hypothetical protein
MRARSYPGAEAISTLGLTTMPRVPASAAADMSKTDANDPKRTFDRLDVFHKGSTLL